MEAYIMEWLYVLVRWLHVITAVAWIGASFYFVWLDNSLQSPKDKDLQDKGVDGELWAVHGGGFYNPQKYLTAPEKLPKKLHWFYWESYSTWMSGFALFLLVYLLNAQVYLIDPNLLPMSPTQAIVTALGFLAGGWFVYDLMCRIFGFRNLALGIAVSLFIGIATYGACQIFPGRAAFLIVGAMMATMMSANVLFVIIPGQKRVTAAMRAGEPVDPIYGQRGKQRSVHNTYFTLPVLFCMLSNHFGVMYRDANNWLVLILMMIAGVLIRQFFLLKHRGQTNWYFPASGIAVMALVFFWMSPIASQTDAPAKLVRGSVSTEEAFAVVQKRCYGCHAYNPTMMGGAPAPKGIVFESPEDLRKHASAVISQTVQLKTMPLGNITQMTDEERQLIQAWFQQNMSH
ncbi:urate hydroxylase PuuD [Pseudobacteriovorax antillogorgiicola]|uniref:Uncharacterized membrane protein n=1 Tax=Pseudobacteriovorax antillogorgiicola TaxID=1513793 RepID=A0A1Y6BVG9_9BACT|nr:urate hydroxylase PuuD [Pseudobacteriovorax antillogorgiicola]TCS52986.1 putative membrane protein [Pseudobacteriovorax antillogorgiicola]SMF27318.1 Uncharacterized membrane protein [Pseudobacteriovorax antillogorgiicola]